MISALIARNKTYESVGLFSHKDAMDKLYNYIDDRIEEASKSGSMSIGFFLDGILRESVGIGLSMEQLKMLAEHIKTKYEENGFSVKCDDADSNHIIVEIGWFSI